MKEATGEGLDRIARGYGLFRYDGESDDALRARCVEYCNDNFAGGEAMAVAEIEGRRVAWRLECAKAVVRATNAGCSSCGRTDGNHETWCLDSANKKAPTDTLRTDLARTFDLAPDAPDEVLLSTAKKVWEAEGSAIEYWQDAHEKKWHEAEEHKRSRAQLADRCGTLEFENDRLRARVGELLLRVEELEAVDAKRKPRR